MLKWSFIVIGVLIFVTIGVYFLLKNSSKSIAKIKVSGFSSTAEMAGAVLARMDQEIKNSASIKVYIPEQTPDRHEIIERFLAAVPSGKKIIFETFSPESFSHLGDDNGQIQFIVKHLISELTCSDEFPINCYANYQLRQLNRKKEKFNRKYLGMLNQIGAQRYLLTFISL